MSLYYIQDGDRPAYVFAESMAAAVVKWRVAISKELDNEDPGEPAGVMHVCDDDEFIFGDDFLTGHVRAPEDLQQLTVYREFLAGVTLGGWRRSGAIYPHGGGTPIGSWPETLEACGREYTLDDVHPGTVDAVAGQFENAEYA